MAVEFIENRDDFGTFWTARVHSPTSGTMVTINPFQPLEMLVSHQTKGKAHGFGLTFTSGKNRRTLQIGSMGETETFLREIKRELGAKWFWAQGEQV
jgi:hypothetical protein